MKSRPRFMSLCVVAALGIGCSDTPTDGGGPNQCTNLPDGGLPDLYLPRSPPHTVTLGAPSGAAPFDPRDPGSVRVTVDDGENLVIDRKSQNNAQPPVIWVSGSGDGVVSKIDTRTQKELARYCTYPGCNADPSRISISLGGDALVGNRAWTAYQSDPTRASAVKIAGDKSRCVDRNHNGKIDTFEGAGPVPAAFFWNVGQADSPDECVIWLTDLSKGPDGKPVPDPGTLPRGAAYDAEQAPNGEYGTYVYIGLNQTREVVRMNAATGEILKRIDVTPVMPYGLALDKSGVIWIRGSDGSLGKLDVKNNDTLKVYNGDLAPPCPYGISVDAKGFVYTSGGDCVSRFDPVSESWEVLHMPLASAGRGMALDASLHAWIADSTQNKLHEVDASASPMVYKGFAYVPNGNCLGAAVDFDNQPWLVCYDVSRIYKINRNDYSTTSTDIGKGPYSYSDLTGAQLRFAGPVFGVYRHIFSGSCDPGQKVRWDSIDFQSNLPDGTQLYLRARASTTDPGINDATFTTLATLPPAAPTPIKLTLPDGMQDRLQIEVVLRSNQPGADPSLSQVTLTYYCDQR